MGVYRMTVKLTFPNGANGGTNTWHVRTTSTPVPPAPTPTAMIKTFYTSIANLFPTSYQISWDGILSEVGNPAPAVVPPMTAWTVPGTGGVGNYGPAGVGFNVCWRSTLATRRGRGRTFVSPILAAAFDSAGTIADSNLAAIRTAANALVSSSLADGNGAVSVWSPSDNLGRDVASASVRDHVSWLSSRRG